LSDIGAGRISMRVRDCDASRNDWSASVILQVTGRGSKLLEFATLRAASFECNVEFIHQATGDLFFLISN